MDQEFSITSLFPSLSGCNRPSAGRQVKFLSAIAPSETSDEVLSELLASYEHNSAYTFVHLAWGYLLSCYLGEPNVAFWSFQPSEAPVPALLHRFNFDEHTSVQQHVQKAQAGDATLSPGTLNLEEGVKSADTLLCVKQSSESHSCTDVSSWSTGMPKFSVIIEVAFLGKLPTFKVTWREDIFPQSHGEVLLNQLQTILHEMISDTNRLPRNISYQKHDISELSIINPHPTVLDESLLLHGLFEQQAKLKPSHNALEFLNSVDYLDTELVEWSYENLNNRANQMARLLLSLGLQPDDRVPIILDQSPFMYITILAILKAGAAYVPLATNLPLERVEFVVQDVSAKVIVTSDFYFGKFNSLPSFQHIHLINLDSKAIIDKISCKPVSDLNSTVCVGKHHLAYVMYTSGSTGKPKGVMIEHGSAVQSILAHQKLFQWTDSSKFLQFASVTFDVSVFEIFFPWSIGITLCGASRDLMLSNLEETINTLFITHMEATPTMAALLHRAKLPTVNTLITIGEMLTQRVVNEWSDGFLHNAYGPTEAAIHCTMASSFASKTKPSNIGIPLDTCSIYIMGTEDNRQPLPVGFVGELYIGGKQVARGYLNRDDLTGAAFFEDPYIAGGRIYKSGDLVRMLPDRTFEFVGRVNDQQVKLRGQRIELGEIDYVLENSHETISDVVTLVLKHPKAQEKQLISFIAAPQGANGADGEVQIYESDSLVKNLRLSCSNEAMQKLPPHMVPKIFIIMNRLPRLNSGKTDRKQLHSIFDGLDWDLLANSKQNVEGDGKEAEPTDIWSPMQLIVRDTLQEMCDSTISSVQVSLFSLGIDSLGAIMFCSRLRKKNLHITVSQLMQNQTIEKISLVLEKDTVLVSSEKERLDAFRNLASLSRDQVQGQEKFKLPQTGLFIESVYPCTPLQEGMLAETLKSTDGSRYYNWILLEIDNSVKTETLEAAWKNLVDKNEILRTGFISASECEETFSQAAFLQLCWSGNMQEQWNVVGVQSDAELQAVITQQRRMAGKLTWENIYLPPNTCSLIRTADKAWLSITIHHSLYDGWCLPLIVEDLQNYILGKEVLKRPDFRNVVEHIHCKDADADSEAFWKEALSEYRPFAFPNLTGKSRFKDVSATHSLEKTFSMKTNEVEALCRSLRLSPQVVAQAAWAKLLRMYTNEDDVAFGLVVSGRTIPVEGIEHVIGPCINTIPCRITMDDLTQTNEQFLTDIQEMNTNMISHTGLPLRSINTLLGINPTQSLFDTLLIYQKTSTTPNATSESAQEKVKLVHSDDLLEHSILVEVEPHGDDITLRAVCKNHIVPPAHTQILLDQFSAFMSDILNNLSGQVGGVLRMANEQLSIGNKAAESDDKASRLLMHSFVERYAKETPEKFALEFATSIDSSNGTAETIKLTYDVLNQEANKIANLLLDRGLQPENIVPICLDKSPFMYIAILGVLKAGGAYAPIDPEIPDLRKQFIVSDVDAKVLLTTEKYATVLGEMLSVDIVALDKEDLTGYSCANPRVPLTSSNLGYLLYTSGTTGTPKGVMVEHRNVTSNLDSMKKMISWTPESRLFQFTTFIFDVSVFEMFFSWSLGITLCSSSKDIMLGDLEGVINCLRVTHLNLTPTASGLIHRPRVPTISALITAGEPLTQRVLDEWAGDNRLSNAYGPTETTNVCTAFTNVQYDTKTSNIGRPLATCSAYITNADMQPVPIGGIGELCIGGPQVTRGYWKKPDLTSEKFVEIEALSFWRVYRTGDLARILADGTVEFLGRLDNQIKLNGFRIELEEINSVIVQSHTSTKDAVTYAIRRPEHQNEILVSFASVAGDREYNSCEIIDVADESAPEVQKIIQLVFEEAKRKLPTYMVPSIVLPVSKLPLGPTGKVNSQTLRQLYLDYPLESLSNFYAVEEEDSNVEDDSIVNTEIENKIRNAIAETAGLTLPEVRSGSNIFHLGLDSINAIQLSSRLRKLNIDLTVSAIMNNPTPRLMTQLFQQNSLQDPSEVAIDSLADTRESMRAFSQRVKLDVTQQLAIDEEKIAAILPCTPLQEGMVAQSTKYGNALYFNHTIFEIKLWAHISRLQEAWNQVAEKREILRTCFCITSDHEYPFAQVVLNEWTPSWVFENLASQEAVEKAIDQHIESVNHTIETSRPPVCFGAFNGPNGVFVVMSMHHALYDGWSLPLLLEDVQAAYYKLKLPIRPSFHQALEYIHSVDKAGSQTFWKNMLSSYEPAMFPDLTGLVNKPNSVICSTRSLVSKAKMSELNSICRALQTTVLAVGQAAWAKLLSFYVGENDVVFGHVLSGRTISMEKVEDVIGPCFNTVPCRVEINPSKTNEDLFKSLQKYNTDVIPYQHTPLRSILKGLGNLDGSPLFDTVFLYQKLNSSESSHEQLWDIIRDESQLEFSVMIELIPEKDDNLVLRITCRNTVMPVAQSELLLSQLDDIILDIVHQPTQSSALVGRTMRESSLSISNPQPKYFVNDKELLLHQLFEISVAKNPHATALEFMEEMNASESQKWTYQQLNDEANRVANLLLSCGLQPDDVVPICMNKGPMTYISILGVLKAGGAYCPVDPEAPVSRQLFIISEVSPRVVLTVGSDITEELRPYLSEEVNLIDLSAELMASQSTAQPHPQGLTDRHLAYVLYTSGTTGKPKGVMLEHASAVQSIQTHQSLLWWEESSKFLQFATYTFDVSIYDMFFSWTVGICLCSASKKLLLGQLTELINAMEITHLDLTPTVAGSLSRKDVPSIKSLYCIGEALTQRIVNDWADDGCLVNSYGPTEATIACTMRRVTGEHKASNIGLPFQTCSAYVLSKQGHQIQPSGCLGELCIGGPQLARGYLGNVTLTAEKFMRVPGIDGLLYRTGDIVRLLCDGTFEYMGRMDDQVKLNGFRIELDEINTVIAGSHQSVEDVITLVIRHPQLARGQLVSFLATQARDDGDFSPELITDPTLKQELIQASLSQARSTLPAYMVPGIILPINKIPVGSAGKVDRKRLMAVFTGMSSVSLQTYLDPLGELDTDDSSWSEIERKIRDILAEVTQTSSDLIGKRSSIFQLGLDSISAIQLSAKLRERGINISIIDIMRNPSVQLMGECLQNQLGAGVANEEEIASQTRSIIKGFAAKIEPQLGAQYEGDVVAVYPCTPLQEGMIAQTLGLGGAYFNHIIYELIPTIDISRLEQAWLKVIESNEILRTSFFNTDDTEFVYAQIVHKKAYMPWTVREVQDFEEVQSISDEYMQKAWKQTENLQRPPISFTVFKGSENSWLLVSMHHAIYDGWSLPLIVKDVFDSYNEKLSLRPQFSQALESILSYDKAAAEEFWKHHLNDYSSAMFPNITNSRKQISGSHLVSKVATLKLVDIEHACQSLGTTVQAVAQAAWAKILSAYMDMDDVIFGHVISGRTISNTDLTEIIGPCFNTIPCRVTVKEVETNLELIQRIHDDNIQALYHQCTPLRSIQKWLEVPNGSSLFDTIFIFQKTEKGEAGDNAPIWLEKENRGEVEYALSIELEPTENGALSISLVCKNATLSKEQSQILLEQFEGLFMDLLQKPHSRVKDYNEDVLPSQLLSICNPSPVVYDVGARRFMHSWVEDFAISNSDKIALEFATEIYASGAETTQWTFEQLNGEANRVAHYLITSGIEIEQPVPVCIPRSPLMYATILGVTKAGGAYVPVDPDAPSDRKNFIIEDTRAKLVLTVESLIDQFVGNGVNAIALDTSDSLARQPTTNLDLESLQPSNLAYILYTSGTTGKPKGVLVEHTNVVHSITAFKKMIKMTPASKFLQFASCGFDVSIFEMFLSWSVGICVCAASKDLILRDIELMISSMGITHADLTPSMAVLVRRSHVPTLQCLVTGGEALTQHVLDEWAGNGLYNAYGPTEATIGCTMLCNVTKDAKASNIGRVFENSTGYVMSASGRFEPVLRGSPGELCIGGPLVTRGYLNRPELTSEKFVSWPKGGSQVLYRTGDLVRLTADNSIEFLGRADSQVKINGIRIELDEINNTLRAVEESVQSVFTILAQHPEQLKKELVSFVVLPDLKAASSGGVTITELSDSEITRIRNIASALIQEARRMLPAYMVPHHILPIATLPLGNTGKADEKKLINMYKSTELQALQLLHAGTTLVTRPWTGTEEIIRKIIVQISPVPESNINQGSSIFQLGLDSLSAILLSSKLRKQGFEISVSQIMQYPVIEQMAHCLDSESSESSNEQSLIEEARVAIKEFENSNRVLVANQIGILESDISAIYPCSPLQEGMIAQFLKSDKAVYLNHILLDLESKIDLEKLREAWRCVVRTHDILRTCFCLLDGQKYIQVVLYDSDKYEMSWEVKSANSEDELITLIEETEAEISKELTLQRPPIRLTVCHCATRVCLLISIHHSLYDGWSLPLILDDVYRCYRGFSLPVRPQFGNFIDYVAARDMDLSKQYWRKALADSTPTSFPELTGTRGIQNAASHVASLTSRLKNSEIEAACHNMGTTVLALGQAAWAKLLSYYVGESEVVFGHVVSGRTIPLDGVEDIVGPCFNTIPCRVEVNEGVTNVELLQAIQQENARALAYQHTPLRSIYRWINRVDDQPLFDTLFLYQKNPSESGNVEERLWKVVDGKAQIDYSISIELEAGSTDEFVIHAACRDIVVPPGHSKILLRQLDQILVEIVTNPQRQVMQLDIEPSCMSIMNPEPQIFDPTNTGLMHTLFEKNAADIPEKIALEWVLDFDDDDKPVVESWSFESFNREANRIAHLILSKSSSKCVVPVCIKKSPLMYIAILAVLKSGNAYVPVDPELPVDRILYMIANVDAPVVLTTQDIAVSLNEGSGKGPAILPLDILGSDLASQSTSNPDVILTANDLAYVLFTSGTTGLPKGVMIEHGSVRESIAAFSSILKHGSNVKFLQFASFSFDVSICEIFLSLSRGYTLCSAAKDFLLSNLERIIQKMEVTNVALTPSVVSIINRKNVPSVRVFVAGGESLTQRVLDEWTDGDVILQNAYGPTETTIGCTLNQRVTRHSKPSNIGGTLPSCSAFVLSSTLQLVPLGGIGELCIGGKHVARGYLKRPDLTVEKFITMEILGRSERIYRTGDLVRILHDGSIDFVGRMDDQVKLNGLRIELEEINHVILQASDCIDDVVTLVIKHPEQQKAQLVAFIATSLIADNSEDLTVLTGSAVVDELKPIIRAALDAAARKLPMYMVPSHVCLVNKMPLGTTGKVNRKLLTQKYQGLDESVFLGSDITQDDYQSWAKQEQKISEAISEVANVPLNEIGRHSSIFQLGLDSISAIKLSAKLKDRGIILSVSDIMKYPTVSRMFNYLEENSDVVFEDVEETLQKTRVLFQELEDEVRSSITESLKISDDEILAIYPCTPMQEGMISHTLQSSGKLYFNHTVFDLKSFVDVNALKEAWMSLIQKNDILRTSFFPCNHTSFSYLQVVNRDVWMPWSEIEVDENCDMNQLVEEHIETAVKETQNMQRPPIAFSVVKKPEQTLLIMSLHHALYDGWSLPLMLQDVHTLYFGEPVPERPAYKNMVEYIVSRPESEANAYWSQALEDCNVSTFPSQGDILDSSSAFIVNMDEISSSMSVQDIEAICQSLDITMQSVGQASWGRLLACYLGESDVTFGRVVSGRTVPVENAEAIMGPSFNTIPCRVTVDRFDNNADLTRGLHQMNVESIKYQHTPLRTILKQANKSTNGQKLFDTLFLYQKGEGTSGDNGRILWDIVDGKAEIEFSVSVEIEPLGDQLMLRAACKNSVMTKHQLRMMLEQLDSLMVDLLENPAGSPESFTELPQRLMSRGNPNPESLGTGPVSLLHQFVEKHAEETPNKIAFEFVHSISDSHIDVSKFTYAEFNRRANQVANFLSSRNVKPETIIPLCFEKSILMYMSIIGVLKAGCAYVPIDPKAPSDRKRYIIQEVEACVVLTSKSLSSGLIVENEDPVEVICLDEVNLSTQMDSNPPVTISPSSLAYVLYTSGTTGVPKGVMIEHHSVVQFFASTHRLLPWESDSRFLQNASYYFDVSIFEMFFTWSVGITIISSTNDNLLSNLELVINSSRITHVAMTPTVASMFHRSNVPTVKYLVAGGEMLTQQVIEEWGDGCSLFNAYGPTEITIGCSLLCNMDKTMKPSNIGSILHTCSCYVVSPKSQVLPRGSVGELCIGGPQVARGYLKRQDLTSQKFIAIPGINERIYRTGDLVRMLQDGSIEFIGRIDDQVKLNGLRIELSEISTVISKSSDLIEGVVTYVLKNQWQSRDQLVSFIACSAGSSSESLALLSEESDVAIAKTIVKLAHTEATKKLPLYMVPSLIIPINKLPRGNTNKTDRKVLEQLYNSLSLETIERISYMEDDETEESVLSEVESTIRDVLAEVGEISPNKIKGTTSIFHLGLDSISAIRVSSKLRSIGLNLTVADILQQLTVKNMARLVNQEQDNSRTNSISGASKKAVQHLSTEFFESIPALLNIPDAPIETVAPCSPAQIFTISSWQNSKKANFMSYFAFKSSERLDSTKLQSAWLSLLKQHSILRTAFVATSDFKMPYVQVVLEQPVLDWTVDELDKELDLDFIKDTIARRASVPVRLDQPPVHAHCIRFLSSTVLVVGLHHALYDGWSLPLLLTDLESAYHDINHSTNSPGFSGFLDYVFSQEEESQTKYWKKYLQDSVPLMFPVMNPNTQTESRTFVLISDALNNVSRYEELCREHQTTMQAIFLAAWATLQCDMLESGDSLFGLYHSGRSAPVDGISMLAAPCVNMLPLYVKNAKTMGLVELSLKIQEDLALQTPYQQAFIHDIQRVVGYQGKPLLNTYVNYLKFSDEGSLTGMFDVLDLLSSSNQIKAIQQAAHLNDNDISLNPAASSIKSDLDIEISVRGDQAWVGIFCQPNILSEAQATDMIHKLCNIVRDAFPL
ncbi:amino acid adenylation [Basidiobolus meristosporus CBS 931.73]|uniref:Amino acid adenylation n=1 Tax=Basidiobolus meristosporus CBS 931.73 TaxID=1314790 RepID=A0A1Y1Z9X3_9FUNG|nr:amino acid adenylation [Basidiobolus meristosporus CBS 931.73]|eukprot:ORY07062.1 amino acid adenylation [Basidiobolus meristosporus CBS 931.73]